MLFTIDTGTTNTRIKLLDGEKVLLERKVNVGVRDTAMAKSNQKLKQSIRDALKDMLAEAGLKAEEVSCILASGMITSDVGLYTLDHVFAPADMAALRKGAKKVTLDDVSPIPFIFIPGVKNNCDYKSIDVLPEMDIMRGEETELFGIMRLTVQNGPFVAVLPGSHTKIIPVNEKNEITACYTTLGGEIIASIAANTILSGSLPAKLSPEVDEEYLLRGYEASRANGFNKAAFGVRLMKLFLSPTDAQLCSYYVGAVLADDIDLIAKKAGGNTLIVGGANPLRRTFTALLKATLRNPILCLDEETVDMSTACGAQAIIFGDGE